MPLDQLNHQMLPAVEETLRQVVERANGTDLDVMHNMLAYHMGWEGEGSGPEAAGKRIRPLIVLLSTASAGKDWKCALPAAAAVELIHNFSLIHDDIQDSSPTRRGRPTVWKIWGVPQAINAGDAMFTLAHMAVLDLEQSVSPQVAIEGSKILQRACLLLTQGQYLDISYEARGDLTQEAYWPMVRGKTAALLSACSELGAVAAAVPIEVRAAYREFGLNLGLAFQAQDDLLGIWGDEAIIGKSTASDLISGKKSLPVLYGLAQNGPFRNRWIQGSITPQEVPLLARQLVDEGARAYTQNQADRLTKEALAWLDKADPQGEAGAALRDLANKLLNRAM